jgi:4-aminobutyrate aminotransferase-like enzyme/Ser/Thr protein kinase RdoA (MazF antagonist)
MPTPTRPTLAMPRLASMASEHWGLGGELRELGSYVDRNYLLATESGERWVVKLSSEPREKLELQSAALQHLQSRPSGPLVPHVRSTLDGRTQISTFDDADRPCTLRMLGYIEGTLWSDAGTPTPALREALGAALGQLDLDLADFVHPAMHHPERWNLCEAAWIADDLHAIEVGQRGELGHRGELVVDALAQFQARVVPCLRELPRQLIHGDANDQNLLVAGDELRGLIDFGDACAAPAVCELAIALAYAGMVPESVQACAEVCVGYHRRRPLWGMELDLLYDLVRARLAVSVVSSALARVREPDNAHAQVSDAEAWSLLGKLTEFGRRAITKYLADACGIPTAARVPGAQSRTRLLSKRRSRMGGALSLSYAEPLYIRRGEGTWLFDEHDQALLDCVNNVSHVGHGHPRVVAAAVKQMAALNTNTRYLHEGISSYAERLAALLPHRLGVLFMVNSGSEANELALRMARAHTGGHDVVVVDGGYHGNTTTLVDISPYKFNGPGGAGKPPWVHVLDTPDPYRSPHGDNGWAAAAPIEGMAADARARGSKLAAFICESVLGCAGQVVPAPGFLIAAYQKARAAGAVCIADEVQVGFGRVGDSMWAFEAEGVIPDILTLGKPMGNGHPIGAVLTSPEIAASFARTGMEYFNSFGGNPVSCAIATAVLDVIANEDLMGNARRMGAWLRDALRSLDDPGIGEVRGRGLFLGVELVFDRETKVPATARAKAVVEHARSRGVLLSVDGPGRNVIKIKPPMCFGLVEAQILVHTLAAGLRANR